MDSFFIFPSELGCITCFDYPTSFLLFALKRTSLAVELEGGGVYAGIEL